MGTMAERETPRGDFKLGCTLCGRLGHEHFGQGMKAAELNQAIVLSHKITLALQPPRLFMTQRAWRPSPEWPRQCVRLGSLGRRTVIAIAQTIA